MGKKILVVDDEPDLLRVLTARLKDRNYDVYPAVNVNQAKVLAKKEKPDLMILDIMMPELSGPELANDIKEDPDLKNVPVIYLSAILSKKEEKKLGGMVAGETIMAKPYEITELDRKIREKLV